MVQRCPPCDQVGDAIGVLDHLMDPFDPAAAASRLLYALLLTILAATIGSMASNVQQQCLAVE
jgi:hypothetical protein